MWRLDLVLNLSTTPRRGGGAVCRTRQGEVVANAAICRFVTGSKNSSEKSPQAVRAELAARLRIRVPEIEKTILTRIRVLSEPVGDEDPSYVAGLRRAVAEAVNYGLEGVEKGRESSVPIPPETARQARRAAREGVRLDTVLLRYTAGNKLLEEFIVAEADDIPSQVLCQVLSDQGPRVDRMMESVAAEYRDELEQTSRSSVQQHAERVVQLLEGTSVAGPIDLDYDFEACHVGMVLRGHKGGITARACAKRLGCRPLVVARDPEIVWAWLGSAQTSSIDDLQHFLAGNTPTGVSVAIGAPRSGLEGWRLSHREAQVAFEGMLQKPQRLVRAGDVALRVSIMRDDTLVRALLDAYLGPLEKEGNTGQMLFPTLRAYFSTGGNAASAAESLGVNRQTVKRRVKLVEDTLGQIVQSCQAELQVALEIEEIQGLVGGSGG